MQLRFLGATGTVTGSKYLLSHQAADGSAKRILIDCGLFQGLKQLRLRNWADLPINPRAIDAVVLTHAHIDHSGYLPLLVKNGFSGKVYCTPATRDLCEVLLLDSAHLQEEEARYANKSGFSKHNPALPLYSTEDAQNALALLAPIAYDKDLDLGAGLTLLCRYRLSLSARCCGWRCFHLATLHALPQRVGLVPLPRYARSTCLPHCSQENDSIMLAVAIIEPHRSVLVRPGLVYHHLVGPLHLSEQVREHQAIGQPSAPMRCLGLPPRSIACLSASW